MHPYFITKAKCDQCGNDLHDEETAELYDGDLFCDSVCAMEYMYREFGVKKVVLTTNMIYRDV